MVLPSGHAQSLAAPRSLSPRERRLVAAVGAVAATLAAIVTIAVIVPGHSTGNGCIDVTIPYSVGGQEFYRCGAAARSMCAAVGAPGGYQGRPANTVAVQCRKARLPVGPR